MKVLFSFKIKTENEEADGDILCDISREEENLTEDEWMVEAGKYVQMFLATGKVLALEMHVKKVER